MDQDDKSEEVEIVGLQDRGTRKVAGDPSATVIERGAAFVQRLHQGHSRQIACL